MKIFGAIGYTILEKDDKKIIIFADNHDQLPKCDHNVNMATWLRSKFNSSTIFLEEVIPDSSMSLNELWTNSTHTQQLKNLYRDNPDIINATDIRPYLIPYSWEILDDIKNNNQKNEFTLKAYLRDIDNFFSLKFNKIFKNLSNYNKNSLKNTKLGRHFIILKRIYGRFLLKYKEFMNKSMHTIHKINKSILHQINYILDNIMEWYTCAHVDLNKNKSAILHTGLLHSENIIFWLIENYGYKEIIKNGINRLYDSDDDNVNGCITLPKEFETQFGGSKKNQH